MFSQDSAFWCEASGDCLYAAFLLDFGGILGSTSVVFLCVFGFYVFFVRATGASGSPFLRSHGNHRNSAANYIDPEGKAYVKD